MKLNLLILTNYFAIEPRDIQGGVGYRYVGLYGSLVRELSKRSPESSIFWYSHNDQSLRLITQNGETRKKVPIEKAVKYALASISRKRANLAVIIAYPHGYPGIRKLINYFLCFGMLKLLATRQVKIIVDDFDPPIEAREAFSMASPSELVKTYHKILEMLTLKIATDVIVLNEFWKQRLIKKYRLTEKRFLIVPNGSLINCIEYNSPKPEGPSIFFTQV